MKFLLLAIMMCLTIPAFSSTPQLTQVKLKNIYTPSGFDSNDKVEVVITGWLPNSCHKEPVVQIKKDLERNIIYLNVESYEYHSSSPFCPENIIPFVKTFDLGTLEPGSYLIMANKRSPSALTARIEIEQTPSDEEDQNEYLQVTNATIDDNQQTLALEGFKRSDCFELVDVQFINNRMNTYSVLPILVKTNDFCPMKMTEASIKVDIPSQLTSEDVMLHIRSLGGESINRIIEKQ